MSPRGAIKNHAATNASSRAKEKHKIKVIRARRLLSKGEVSFMMTAQRRAIWPGSSIPDKSKLLSNAVHIEFDFAKLLPGIEVPRGGADTMIDNPGERATSVTGCIC
jgi:hypothetical protein